jgi:hypothetical protein
MHELLATQDIEFTTVTLNERGEIRDRSIHHARQFIEPLGHGLDLEMIALPGRMFRLGAWWRLARHSRRVSQRRPAQG